MRKIGSERVYNHEHWMEAETWKVKNENNFGMFF